MSLVHNHNIRVEKSQQILTSDPRVPPGIAKLFVIREGRHCYVAIRRCNVILSKLINLPVKEVNVGVIIGTLRKNGKRHFILPLHPDCDISRHYFIDASYFRSCIPADELDSMLQYGYELCNKYTYSKLIHHYIPMD